MLSFLARNTTVISDEVEEDFQSAVLTPVAVKPGHVMFLAPMDKQSFLPQTSCLNLSRTMEPMVTGNV